MRIAAKGTVSDPSSQSTHDRRYDQTSHYGHLQGAYSQAAENYPPQGHEIAVVPSIYPDGLRIVPSPFSAGAPSTSKRKDPEGAASAPKPKRPRAKAKQSGSETPSSSTPGACKLPTRFWFGIAIVCNRYLLPLP